VLSVDVKLLYRNGDPKAASNGCQGQKCVVSRCTPRLFWVGHDVMTGQPSTRCSRSNTIEWPRRGFVTLTQPANTGHHVGRPACFTISILHGGPFKRPAEILDVDSTASFSIPRYFVS